MEEKFLLPGSEGELDPSANIWRKGIVFTKRAGAPVRPGYRVSAVFKRSVPSTQPLVGFHRLYERVALVANQRVSGLTLIDPSLAGVMICHGWRLLGDSGNVAAAFITLALRSPDERVIGFDGEHRPTDEELRAPGGASIEDVARLAPQRADELYNEFDFTGPATQGCDLITVSYAETNTEIPEGDSTDFQPFVEGAETFAESYYNLLKRLGEVNSPFRPAHREWFLADRQLITVHICFSR